MPALVVPTRAPALVVASIDRTGRAALPDARRAISEGAGALLTADPATLVVLMSELRTPVVVAAETEEDLALASSLGAAACLLESAGLTGRSVPGLCLLAPPQAILVPSSDPAVAAAEAAAALAHGARVLAGPAVRVLRRCADVWALLDAAVRP